MNTRACDWEAMKPAVASEAEILSLAGEGFILMEKVDGIRAAYFPEENALVSADKKLFGPVQTAFAKRVFAGISHPVDMELSGSISETSGERRATFQETMSFWMSANPRVQGFIPKIYIFDIPRLFSSNLQYKDILDSLHQVVWNDETGTLEIPAWGIGDAALAYLLSMVNAGEMEGIVARSPNSATYRFGRCTAKDHYAYKYVREERREAVIVSYYRRRAQGVSLNALGGFVVRDLKTGVELNVSGGVGWSMDWRREAWEHRDSLVGAKILYLCKPFGELDAPRSPQFVSFASQEYQALEPRRFDVR